MPTITSPRENGFTLLEVLVALAVLAFTLGAILKAGADNAAAVGYLRDKTFAHWVATDKITELRLEPAWPSTGERRGETEFADATWRWTSKVEETPDDRVRRVTVRVMREDDRTPLIERVGYLPRPPAAPSTANNP